VSTFHVKTSPIGLPRASWYYLGIDTKLSYGILSFLGPSSITFWYIGSDIRGTLRLWNWRCAWSDFNLMCRCGRLFLSELYIFCSLNQELALSHKMLPCELLLAASIASNCLWITFRSINSPQLPAIAWAPNVIRCSLMAYRTFIWTSRPNQNN